MAMPLTVCGSSTLILEKPFLQNKNGIGSANANAGFLHLNRKPEYKIRMPRNGRIGEIKAIASSTYPVTVNKSITVKSVVTVLKKTGVTVPSTTVQSYIHLNLELASNKLDTSCGKEKPTIKGEAILKSETLVEEIYEASFEVPSDFGELGAVIVEHYNDKEKYVKDIVLEGFCTAASITINCNSWVQPTTNLSPKRVFFTNKSYLVSKTPGGIRNMRKEELARLRGDGKGKREKGDRIYDYDVYNDLGDNNSLIRNNLGGNERPYPRRCRTGRDHYPDSTAEKRPSGSETMYVPRDESFSDSKQAAFVAKTKLGFIHTVIPQFEQFFGIIDFPSFKAIDELYGVGLFKLPILNELLFFDSPETLSRDQFFWLSDEEFARQTLAGLNPLTIQLVTEWPFKSTLDPDIYGPQESAITREIVEKEIGGLMTIEEAIREKKVFILDYHDALLPYVEKVRDLKDLSLYGSRTLFFLNPDDTLRPLVIELTRPKMHEKPQWKKVLTPSTHGTDLWQWRIAKAHVLSHDSGIHQLISHWLRTHCAVEPYVIATHRQLSAMHPIYRLLHPHFRYTLEINASARTNLISGGGVIESTFALGKYCMELSSDIYAKQWRFDSQALPTDLINRGMAIEDSTQKYGVKLIIEDYPYANDGLIVWDALKQWVTKYVYHYYQDSDDIKNDTELQAWWNEIITVGHGDKKGEAWWPKLNTPKDLIDIITNISWVASGHHAAVNFGQYAYAGYVPNRPTIARTNFPTEDQFDQKEFIEDPQKFLLKCFPSQVQATKVMFILDLLSTHDPDEEYLGKNPEPSWVEDPEINAAFKSFSDRMDVLDKLIDHRNEDSKLKNRNGAGVLPYELLKPTSVPGVTGKGIPYSVSI